MFTRNAFRKTFIATDRWFNLAFVALWFSYALWSTVAAYFELPSLLSAVTPITALIYTGVLAVTSTTALIGGLFLNLKLEFYSAILFGAMLSGYGVVTFAYTFDHSDTGWGRVILIFASLIMPVFRIRHLAQRIRR